MSLKVAGYELHERLGTGGTATVWRASDVEGRVRAIKILQPCIYMGRGAALVLREVQAMARLRHENIISVVDTGALVNDVAEHVAGSPWMALEFADVGSLEAVVALPWSQVRVVADAVLRGLAHAHAHGVLHCDVKPANVVVFKQPRLMVKLTDFGIARSWTRGVAGESVVEGTPQYMAPEQLLAQPHLFGPWTDLYAVGVMVFRLVTGRVPFDGRLIDILLAQDSKQAPTTPLLSAAQNAWLNKLLSRAAGDRFPTAAAARRALADLDGPRVGERHSDGVDLAAVVASALLSSPSALTEIEAMGGQDKTGVENTLVVVGSGPTLVRPGTGFTVVAGSLSLLEHAWGHRLDPLINDDVTADLVDRVAPVDNDGPRVGKRPGAGVSVVVHGRDEASVGRVLAAARVALHEEGRAWTLTIPGDDPAPVRHALEDFLGLAAGSSVVDLRERLAAMGFALDERATQALSLALHPSVSENDRRRALRSTLEALQRQQRVVVFVDDAAADARSLEIAADLLAARTLPVVVGLGEDATAAAQRAVRGTTSDRLRLFRYAIELEVAPTSKEHLARRLREALPMTEAAAALVNAFGKGDSAATTDILRDGRRRGVFVDQGGVLDVVGASNDGDDAGLADYCALRVQAALQPLTSSEVIALERAAAWCLNGLVVNEAEWRASLPGVSAEQLSQLLQNVDELGLVRWSPSSVPARVRFLHAGFKQAVLDHADRHFRRAAHHRACADTLDALHAVDRGSSRVARHFMAAGQPALARDAWRASLQRALIAGDETAARYVLDDARAALGDDDDGDVYAAWIDVLERKGDRARAVLDRHRGNDLAEFVVAIADIFDGKAAQALPAFEQAAQALSSTPALCEHARFRCADAHYYRGALDEAEDAYVTLGAMTSDAALRVHCVWSAAWVRMAKGDNDGALKGFLAAEASPDATPRDRNQIENALADLARHSGRLDEAETRYRRALLSMRAIADANLAIVISNLVVTLVDKGDDQEARALAKEAMALVESTALRGFSLWPLLAAIYANSGASDVSALVDLVDRVEAFIGDLAEVEFAACADKAAARLDDADSALAARLRKIAADQRKRLGA